MIRYNTVWMLAMSNRKFIGDLVSIFFSMVFKILSVAIAVMFVLWVFLKAPV